MTSQPRYDSSDEPAREAYLDQSDELFWSNRVCDMLRLFAFTMMCSIFHHWSPSAVLPYRRDPILTGKTPFPPSPPLVHRLLHQIPARSPPQGAAQSHVKTGLSAVDYFLGAMSSRFGAAF